MELGKSEVSETSGENFELDFDPDKLIGSNNFESEMSSESPESVLHDPESIYEPITPLDETHEGFQELGNGNTIYNHPYETAEILNKDQGSVYSDIKGDCGLVSIENVCRLAGKDLSEADVVVDAISTNECYYNPIDCPTDNGGTNLDNIIEVLGHFGIESDAYEAPEVNEVADAVESGKGVIAIVDAVEYNPDAFDEGLHAITVTSVERNPDGSITAFYVCDSGTHGVDGCKRVGVDTFEKSAYAAVITNDTIR